MDKSGRAIVWFRRDLRVDDNPALVAALRGADEIVPLFVRDPRLSRTGAAARPRDRRLDAAVASLDAMCRALGGRLIVREGRPEELVPAVARETGARVVHAHREYTPFGVRRDDAVGRTVDLRLHGGLLATEPEATGDHRRFAPFHRAWTAAAVRRPLDPPQRLRVPEEIDSLPIPSERPSGEHEAMDRARAFATTAADRYAEHRDRLDIEATSRLSADLHFGTLSVVRLSGLVGEPSFRRQLAWRDWAHHLVRRRPEDLVPGWSHGPGSSAWRDDAAAFDAWRSGRTGYPAVDAAMRQLESEGWISNRARLIVGSFLTRHLLLDPHIGERHFLSRLVDADVANNALGWRWAAGAWVDPAPYVRILNPVLQSERFDPEAVWLRRWIPELRDLPTPLVHRPWDAGLLTQQGYPPRIVDHRVAVERARSAYRRV